MGAVAAACRILRHFTEFQNQGCKRKMSARERWMDADLLSHSHMHPAEERY